MLYRVHKWQKTAHPGAPYSAQFIPPQGYGRWDNPDLYQLRYLTTAPEGAIAESFGQLASWGESMLHAAYHADSWVRALSVFSAPDDLLLADLADPAEMLRLKLRATDVVSRERRATQRLAARIYEVGEYEGISWWSFYHPEITPVALFQPDRLELLETVPLQMEMQVVQDAAALITRAIV